ncbi:MAG: hypothetical protein IH830_00885 [Planctomycetes bacterium]|nr:hypothetical protein [Planctomycetota bacterium]
MTSVPTQPLRHAIRPAKQGARRHYGSHPYFTKRSWNVVQEYIKHFSSPGDTVSDPFGGSGVTAVESLVLGRKAIYADISQWACFLAKQTALAPVDLRRLEQAFREVEDRCKREISEIWSTPDRELRRRPVRDWYPKRAPLPDNSDVRFVDELFTPRMLHGLARLRTAIMEVAQGQTRDLLLFAFSATLARINRTFLSTANRSESRGGAAIFSIYRYKIAKRPVELPLWDQFARRFERVVQAKRETNHLIGDFYQENETAVFRHASATSLLDWLQPESVDYIYTDPPYGGNISYLDLSTMWAAWLGFDITIKDRSEEVIEGGQLRKSPEVYQHLLAVSMQQMYEILKNRGWMSIVFAHRQTSYWETLVDACRQAGFQYVNTVVQPVGVVWSMHKKKNPIRVLSGELVLNFRKVGRVARRRTPPHQRDPTKVVRECCERVIVDNVGATTEDLHHALIPKLLETGLLSQFSHECGDITPLLQRLFEFDEVTAQWYLPLGKKPVAHFSDRQLARYYIVRFLARRDRVGRPPTELEVSRHVRSRLKNAHAYRKDGIVEILSEIGYSPDDRHWRLALGYKQHEFSFST